MHEVLGSVTHAQDRDHAFYSLKIGGWCVLVPHRERAARQDHAFKALDTPGEIIIRMNITENIQFPYPSCDKLGILGTEIEDQYRFLHEANLRKSADERSVVAAFIPDRIGHHQVEAVLPPGHMLVNEINKQAGFGIEIHQHPLPVHASAV